MTNLLATGGVFEPLKDRDFFVNRLTVMNDTIAWDISGFHDSTNCVDIDPFAVYDSEVVSDTLESVIGA